MINHFYTATGWWSQQSSHAPYFVDNFSSSGNGKLWYQSTSACAAQSPNWVGCDNWTAYVSNGQIKYQDLTVNSTYCRGDSGNILTWGCNDFVETLTHELGHAQGLAHSTDKSSSVMFPQGDVAPSTLEQPRCGDKARIQMIYGS